MEKLKWTDNKSNQKVWKRVREDRNPLSTIGILFPQKGEIV